MKYRVLGHSKDTGAKMTLELDAASKADAERKAKSQNLNIIRIEPADPAETPATTFRPIPAKRTPTSFVATLLLLALLAAAWYFWPTLRSLLPH